MSRCTKNGLISLESTYESRCRIKLKAFYFRTGSSFQKYIFFCSLVFFFFYFFFCRGWRGWEVHDIGIHRIRWTCETIEHSQKTYVRCQTAEHKGGSSSSEKFRWKVELWTFNFWILFMTWHVKHVADDERFSKRRTRRVGTKALKPVECRKFRS